MRSSNLEAKVKKLVSAAAAWPPNRNFLYYCLYLWLKIPSVSKNINMNSDDLLHLFSQLIDSIPQKDKSLLASMSDIHVADQRIDIPIGWYNKPYRFFFGDIERPLAFMNKFLEDFVPLNEIFRDKSGFSPAALLNLSLLQQDILIGKLEELTSNIDSNPSNSLHMPPFDFQDKWWQCLEESWNTAYNRLSEKDKQEIETWLKKQIKKSESSKQISIDYETITNLFVVFKSDSEYIIPFPQMWLSHLVGLFTQEARKLPADPTINRTLSYSTKNRTIQYLAMLSQQTPDAELFPDVYLKLGEETSSEVDAMLLVDIDKLIAVKSAVDIDSEEFKKSIDYASTSLSSVCDLIYKADNTRQLSVERNCDHKTLSLDTSAGFIVYPLIITNQIVLEPIIMGLENAPINTQVMMLTDLEAITYDIEDTLDFVRFLKAICKLKESKVRLVYTDFLDLWEWYRSNGHNFLWSADKHPNAILLQSHWYSEKETKGLVEKASLRRLMIEEGIPERCKYLASIDQDTFRLMDPISLIGIAVKTSTMQPETLIIHICSRESDGKDVSSNESLAESILRRYEEIRDVAKKLIELAPPDNQNRLVIWLYGERTLRSSSALRYLESHLDKNPLECVISRGTILSSKGIGVAILYRDSLLERMGHGTIEGELLLTKATLRGIAYAVKAPHDTLDSILSKVSISSKKGINVASIDTIHMWNEPHKPHQRSPATKAQTTVQIAQMLSSIDIKPAEYRGQQARDLINRKVFPLLRELLDDNLRELEIGDVVRWVYLQVENSSAYYQIERMKLGSAATSLEIEYDFGKAAYDIQSTNVQIIEAGSLILERLALTQPSGTKRITREIGEKLLDYAISLLEYSQSSEQDYYNIEEIAFEISDDYAFKLDIAKDSVLDIKSWQSDFAADDFSREQPVRSKSTKNDKRERYPDSDPELKDINAGFRNQFEYGLADLLEVLVGLSSFPINSTDSYFPLANTDEKTLLDHLSSAIVDGHKIEAKKVLADLCLKASSLQEEWKPWLLRSRRHRFTMRPLFPLGDNYVFGPWFLERTCKIWLAYLNEGKLPIPESVLSPQLCGALQRFRDEKNRQFEDEVSAEIDNLKLPKIGPRAQRPEELWGNSHDSPVGEIDVLAAEVNNRNLYVLEVKDPARTLVVDDIANQIRDYYEGDTCFQSKLLKKTNYIKSRLPAVLSTMGINQSLHWQVKPVFITRFPVAAGYYKERKCPFLPLRNIGLLKSPDV